MCRLSLRPLFVLPLLAPISSAQVTAPPGWNVQRHAISSVGAPVGLARLPSGHLVTYDGTSVVELDRNTGRVTRTLFTPPGTPFGPPFGSFLRFEPMQGTILFGENSTGWIWAIDPVSFHARQVVNLPHNFDAAFDPVGRLFVSANTNYVFGQRSPNEIWFVDPATGATDLVAEIDGPSGPLSFTPAGDLLYVPQSWTFPAPRGSLELLRFPRALVESALGPTHLTGGRALVSATGLSGAYSLVTSGDGVAWVSDPTRGEIQKVATSGAAIEFEGHAVDHFTSLLFESREATPFQSYGPEDAGSLLALATDYGTTHHFVTFRPERCRLRATAPNPVPRGPFALVLDRGPVDGYHVPAIALRAAPTWVIDLGLPVALDFELTSLLTLLPAQGLDPHGNALLGLDASSVVVGTSLVWQSLVLDRHALPVGSTNALTVVIP